MTAANPENATQARPHARVLVVDDERDMLEILQDFLADEGFDVTLANSGERAIEEFSRAEFDLVITDLRMPGIDGLQTLIKLKQLNPRVPVIIVSGYASEDTEQRCRGAGAFECVQKPVDLDDLLKLITTALQQGAAT